MCSHSRRSGSVSAPTPRSRAWWASSCLPMPRTSGMAADSHPGRGILLRARHGQTDDNLEPIRAQGFRDTPLNAVGRRQAQELAERMAEEWIASLWASDLSRAAETARIVGARIDLEPQLDPRLREGNRGDWEGKLFIDIRAEDPDGYAAWRRAGE